jgi:hypothetical protein
MLAASKLGDHKKQSLDVRVPDMALSRLGCRSPDWKPEGKATSLTGRAVHIQSPPMCKDQVASDAQAQSHPLGETPSGLAPIKGDKDTGLFFRRDAHTGITHLNLGHVVLHIRRDGNCTPGRRILDRITEQIS